MKIKSRLKQINAIRQAYYLMQEIADIRNNFFRIKNWEKIKSLRNRHKNQRCFIIGNGPSLNGEDLNAIKQEYSFACNRIFKIFGQTSWRPTYYCCQDEKVLEDIAPHLREIAEVCDLVFLRMNSHGLIPKAVVDDPRTILYKINYHRDSHENIRFSENIAWNVYEGHTVLYSAIQIAVFMGFTEIYLLGVDHKYSTYLNEMGEIAKDEAVIDYFEGMGDIGGKWNIPNTIASTEGFFSAKRYAEEHGIKILNATRGGELEVFDRADLDQVMSQHTRKWC